MTTANNVVDLATFKKSNHQELVDDIGARTFLFLRDQAQSNDLPIKDVIVEHMLGMAMVISSVEGEHEAQHILSSIGKAIGAANDDHE